MVHVQDVVSSALKTVTVHCPVINTWQPYGFCIFGFRQCISFISVHKEISEYKTATVRAYLLNVTARAGRMPLNKVFKQFSLIFAIKQSNNKLINVVFITSCLSWFHLQIFKLQVFLCIIYLSSGNRNLMNSRHIYLQHEAFLYFFKWQWRLCNFSNGLLLYSSHISQHHSQQNMDAIIDTMKWTIPFYLCISQAVVVWHCMEEMACLPRWDLSGLL